MTKKQSYGNCSECPLNTDDQTMVLIDTNVMKSIDTTQVLIVGESPRADEVKTGKPLAGSAGSIFKKYFHGSNLSKLKWAIVNTVLCSNIDKMKKSNKPPKKAAECCHDNIDKFIELTNPDYILALGSVAMNRFGIIGPITKMRGSMYDYKHPSGKVYKVLASFHPRYLTHNHTSEVSAAFENDMKDIVFRITGVESVEVTEEINLDLIHTFKYPDFFFDAKYTVYDIQYYSDLSEVAFIFKDKQNEKKIHIIPSSEYYHYEDLTKNKFKAPMLNTLDNVKLVHDKINTRDSIDAVYENDISPDLKHSIDYYFQRNHKLKIDEPPLKLDVLFCDIEVYSAGKKAFPNPNLAAVPINAISFKLNDSETQVYIVNLLELPQERIEELSMKNTFVTFFNDERSMLVEFCKFVRSNKIDILTGWNFILFDMPFIFNRMIFNQIPHNNLSMMGRSNFNNGKHADFYIGGLAVVDLLELYKELGENKKASYKLMAIANDELGKGKVEFEGSLDELFINDIQTFIDYSKTDTDILYELDHKLDYFNVKQTMLKVASSNWGRSHSTMGLIDPLVITYAKKKNIVCKDVLHKKVTESIPGGFVKTPTAGIFNDVVDFDYTSLYPNLILTYNIGPNTIAYGIDPLHARLIIYNHEKELPEEMQIVTNVLNDKRTKIVNTKQFLNEIKSRKLIVTIAGFLYKSHDEEISFFSEICSSLISLRTVYKNKMKESKRNKDGKHEVYFNIQFAYKILVNSLYGVIAMQHFRFFAIEMAKSITLSGQESVKFLAQSIEDYLTKGEYKINDEYLNDNFDSKRCKYSLYSDTDSVFVHLQDYIDKIKS